MRVKRRIDRNGLVTRRDDDRDRGSLLGKRVATATSTSCGARLRALNARAAATSQNTHAHPQRNQMAAVNVTIETSLSTIGPACQPAEEHSPRSVNESASGWGV